MPEPFVRSLIRHSFPKGVEIGAADQTIFQKNHSFGVGLGAYDGKAAFAVALNSRLDENLRGRISIARGTQDKTIGFGAGLLWQW